MSGEGIERKLGVLRENLERLEQIPCGSFEEFASDFRNIDRALHRLQTSIQALIDLGTYKVARLGLPPPDSSREVLEILERNAQVPVGTAQRYAPLFAFRNRVVHLYDRIDAGRIYEILRDNRRDLAVLADLLLAIPD